MKRIIIVNSTSKKVRVTNDTRSELAAAKLKLQTAVKDLNALKEQLFVLQAKVDKVEYMRKAYEQQVNKLRDQLLEESK